MYFTVDFNQGSLQHMYYANETPKVSNYTGPRPTLLATLFRRQGGEVKGVKIVNNINNSYFNFYVNKLYCTVQDNNLTFNQIQCQKHLFSINLLARRSK